MVRARALSRRGRAPDRCGRRDSRRSSSARAQSQAPLLPLGPNRNAGEAVTGAFEGWFYRPDGSVSLLVGYFNRNLKQIVDIPVGPNNRIEPGGPDFGQPTHFLPRRQWAVFSIPVPKDFGDTETHLDDRGERPDDEHSAQRAPEVSGGAVRRKRHGQYAADAAIRAGRRRPHGSADRRSPRR